MISFLHSLLSAESPVVIFLTLSIVTCYVLHVTVMQLLLLFIEFVTIQSHTKLRSANACIQTDKQFYMAK